MTLKTGLTIFVALISINFIALSISLIRMSDLLDLDARKLVSAGESIRLAEEMKSRLLIHNRNAFLYTLYNDPSRLMSRRTQHTQVMNLLETLDQLVNSEEEQAILEDVKREINAYYEKRREFADLGIPPVEQYTRISQYVDEALAMVDMLIEVNLQQMSSLMETIDRQNRAANRVAVLLLMLGGLVLMGIIVGIVVYVTRPLALLADVIEKYGAGESLRRIEIKGMKEIRIIGSTFNSMADHLEERRQEQLQFIASIAHDIRNPLNSISMASALLTRNCEEKDRGLAKIVLRQVKNLEYLVSDLLDISRIEAGQLDLEVSDQDMGALVRDSVELYKTHSDLHGFKVKILEDPLLCRCDGRCISQVMNNLISNAIKYSPNGGVVKVKAWKKEDQVIISVTDQGIGIAPQDIDNIFKSFHRARATKETIPGIGLGLSSSRRIVEAHGGKLDVESTPGKGSTFYIKLPVQVDLP